MAQYLEKAYEMFEHKTQKLQALSQTFNLAAYRDLRLKHFIGKSFIGRLHTRLLLSLIQFQKPISWNDTCSNHLSNVVQNPDSLNPLLSKPSFAKKNYTMQERYRLFLVRPRPFFGGLQGEPGRVSLQVLLHINMLTTNID
ncbi:hypothetical protein VNO77_42189 [Canavalia gladiata]|uniref:Uncharacterized protein n=1 Tax=Canavalia gladiata TaxID=3824 RepID=A0AAN9PS69_CANGL